jgi:DNA-directed RNA polymerase specialized sigma24 family protein
MTDGHLPEAEARLKELMLLSLGGDAAAYRLLLSELSARLRGYYRRQLGAIDVDDCEELFAPDDIEQAAASHDVERMLAGLPTQTGEAIRLTRLEGHSVEETAKRTGKSVTATKVSIHRGLLRLAQRRGVKLDADE